MTNKVRGEDMNSTNIRPLVGLLGVLVAALSADLNEFVSAAALIDVRGALGISADPGRWIDSLYVTGASLGMAFAPWCAVTFTLRRFTLFAIGLACAATTLLAVAPDLQAILALRLIQGLSGGLTIPLLMTTALRVLSPPIRLYGLALYALTITFSPNISNFLRRYLDRCGPRLAFGVLTNDTTRRRCGGSGLVRFASGHAAL
jgi:MFS transporter, DHA2 family, multidrug resistance protein